MTAFYLGEKAGGDTAVGREPADPDTPLQSQLSDTPSDEETQVV